MYKKCLVLFLFPVLFYAQDTGVNSSDTLVLINATNKIMFVYDIIPGDYTEKTKVKSGGRIEFNLNKAQTQRKIIVKLSQYVDKEWIFTTRVFQTITLFMCRIIDGEKPEEINYELLYLPFKEEEK